MTWRASLERQKPTQKRELPFPVKGDGRPPLRARYHCTWDQQENFIQRMDNLGRLMGIFDLLEMGQKVRRCDRLRVIWHVKTPKKVRFTPLVQKNTQMSAIYSVD